ncbi:MAG: hypothetical protein EOM80_14020 [Erysipelotrichia bacterium]|nr:hypothetical protein [Erysipelotrichia bacterium]
MKRALLVALFVISTCSLSSQTHNFDITSPFKLWLLNNEARVFSSLSSDELLISRVSMPLSFMPLLQKPVANAEEKLWETHRKFYVLLDEAQRVYSVARRFGNGRFAIVLKQARPETWSILPFQIIKPALPFTFAGEYRKAFHNTLLKALKLDAEQDLDLSECLARSLKKLSDEEYRLLNDYLNTFVALFPAEKSATMLKAFISDGSKKKFATGIQDFLKPSFSQPVVANEKQKPAPEKTFEDPLAELEKLSGDEKPEAVNNDETAAFQSNDTDEATPQISAPPTEPEDDIFKIWD